MEFSFEKSEIIEEKSSVIPEINDSTLLAEDKEFRAEELLELLESARINGDI